MDLEDLDACNICMEYFDENLRPRNLPCGHTFCTVCITNGIKDGNIECPNCKVLHQASSTNDFPINYIAEAFISKIRESKQAIEQGPEDEIYSELERVSIDKDIVSSDLCESVKDVIEGTIATEAEAEDLRAFLWERMEKHRNLIKNISYMVRDNENVIKELYKDDAKVVQFLNEGEKYRKEVSSVMQKINNATEDSEISSSREEFQRLHDMLVGWNMRCKKQLPLIGSLKESRKIVAKTIGSLSHYRKEVDDNTYNIYLSDTSLSITDKKNIFENRVSSSVLNKILTSRKTNFEKLIVCAIKEIEGSVYTAELSFEDRRAYLHCLKKGKPPTNALVIQYDELTEILHKDSVVAFMDLALKESILGRIHILLSPEIPLATHFWKLCTGEMGFSYLETTFRNGKRYNHKFIHGGFPEGLKFTGIEDDGHFYIRDLNPGSVGSLNNLDQFQIYLKGSGALNNIFGQVQEGMKLLRKVAKLDDITKVRIEDGGIVFPSTFCCF